MALGPEEDIVVTGCVDGDIKVNGNLTDSPCNICTIQFKIFIRNCSNTKDSSTSLNLNELAQLLFPPNRATLNKERLRMSIYFTI